MARWFHRLNLSDLFGDETIPFPERRDAIVERIRSADFYDEEDVRLVVLVVNLKYSVDEEEFDSFWDDFYDWADDERVWVDTF